MIDQFVTIFIIAINSGIKLMATSMIAFSCIMACIDFTMIFITESITNFNALWSKILNKILRYGIFIAIGLSWFKLHDSIMKLLFGIGYLFWENPPSSSEMGSFQKIYDSFTLNISDLFSEFGAFAWYQIGQTIIILIGILIGYVCLFILMKEVMLSFFKLKIMFALGPLLLPFNMFDQTKSMGEKLFNGLLNAAAELVVTLSVAGISLKVMNMFPYVRDSTPNIGKLISWLFCMALAAFMVYYSKEMSSMLMNGSTFSRSSSAIGGVISGAVGATIGVATGGALVAAGAAGGISKAIQAGKDGLGFKGVAGAFKTGAKEGMKAGQNSFIGKVGGTVGKGIKTATSYATGQKSISNIAGDIFGGAKNVKDIAGHAVFGDEKYNDSITDLFAPYQPSAAEYASTEMGQKAWEAAKAKYGEARTSENKSGLVNSLRKGIQEYLRVRIDKDLRREAYDIGNKQRHNEVNKIKAYQNWRTREKSTDLFRNKKHTYKDYINEINKKNNDKEDRNGE